MRMKSIYRDCLIPIIISIGAVFVTSNLYHKVGELYNYKNLSRIQEEVINLYRDYIQAPEKKPVRNLFSLEPEHRQFSQFSVETDSATGEEIYWTYPREEIKQDIKDLERKMTEIEEDIQYHKNQTVF